MKQPRLDTNPTSYRQQRGLSLIETMIALVLGIVIIGAVIITLISNKQTYRMSESLSRMQENARFALDTLNYRIRMSGYTGCYGDLSSVDENTLDSIDTTDFKWRLNSVDGYEAGAAPSELAGALAGSDVLIVRGMNEGIEIVSGTNSSLSIASSNNIFAAGDLAMVSNCNQATIFQVTNISDSAGTTTLTFAIGAETPGNSVDTFVNLYSKGARVGRLQTHAFYIRNGLNGRPSLYQSTLANNVTFDAKELVPNIENLQVVYGVDNDSDRYADNYQNATAITDWPEVVSIRFALLISSTDDNLTSLARSYSFSTSAFTFNEDATPTVAADRRIKRTFTGFAALRNRTL